MRNMSVSCDCEGADAEPVVTPDVGIVASLDILAADNACIDLLYSLPDGGGKTLIERVETRHGLRQLSYMKELGMGNDRYTLIDIDNNDAEMLDLIYSNRFYDIGAMFEWGNSALINFYGSLINNASANEIVSRWDSISTAVETDMQATIDAFESSLT
jgi:hypothetical protein